MVSATGRDAPLLIIGMYRKQIGQSTVLPGALNTITITIATTDPLYESRGAAVHLYGLTGTNTQDGSLAIRGEDALSSAMFQTQAEWTQSDGHLIILLAGTSSCDVGHSGNCLATNGTNDAGALWPAAAQRPTSQS